MMLLIDAFICMHVYNRLTQKQPLFIDGMQHVIGIVFDSQWSSHTQESL